MLICDYTGADWDQVRPIISDVVTAADTFAYDPDWPPETLREVWVERPPGRTSVAVDHDGAVCGTAKMGAVVDERCRVYGVDNLWVVDGSVLPGIPSRGPHATIVMAGHRAAEFVSAAYAFA